MVYVVSFLLALLVTWDFARQLARYPWAFYAGAVALDACAVAAAAFGLEGGVWGFVHDMVGEGVLAFFLFVVGAFLSTFVLNPVRPSKYLKADRAHFAGFVGAMVWGVGTGINFVAAGAAGAAIAFGLGQGATLVSALWGIFVWREFSGAPKVVHCLNAAFAILFVCGLVSLILAGA